MSKSEVGWDRSKIYGGEGMVCVAYVYVCILGEIRCTLKIVALVERLNDNEEKR